jgi:hypothetical protein
MKLSEYKKVADNYTSKASEINRQLSLAGVAIIWLFKNPETSPKILDTFLVYPLLFLSISLLSDLIQYVIGGYTWINFFRDEEKKVTLTDQDPEIKASKSKSIPIYFFYYLKIVLMLLAYIFLVVYLIGKI